MLENLSFENNEPKQYTKILAEARDELQNLSSLCDDDEESRREELTREVLEQDEPKTD